MKKIMYLVWPLVCLGGLWLAYWGFGFMRFGTLEDALHNLLGSGIVFIGLLISVFSLAVLYVNIFQAGK